MKENKNSCPVCFTKMKPHKDGLMCPECGYKLCDHTYNRQDIYDTSHTHTPDYKTYTASPQPAKTVSSAKSANSSHPQTDAGQNGKNIGKVFRTVVIIYIVIMLLSVFGSIFGTFFRILF